MSEFIAKKTERIALLAGEAVAIYALVKAIRMRANNAHEVMANVKEKVSNEDGDSSSPNTDSSSSDHLLLSGSYIYS
jgi:hypothetical protein